MKVVVFGTGYVGVVSAACLLRDGHTVVGVDPVAGKVAELSAGRSPLQEPLVAELLAAGHAAGRLSGLTDPAAALEGADVVWICVGTPSRPDGAIELGAVEAVAEQLGAWLRAHPTATPTIVLRSTVLPGTTLERFVPRLEAASGRARGPTLPVCFHPEFLREGSAVKDFDQPPKIVVGEVTPGAAAALWALYPPRYEAPRFTIAPAEAELVKYADNLFHAVKITFANEVGALGRAAGVDARRVADVFCADTKLNISAAYLRPGFAFGGSCLPKDLRAILRHAQASSLPVPMLAGMMESNARQIEALVQRILAHKPRVVGLVGLAFKPDTDDMRESPYVAVAKRLVGEGVELRIWDPAVDPARLVGANRDAVRAALRHLESMLVGSLDGLDGAGLVLVNHARVDAARVTRWCEAGARVLDLASIRGLPAQLPGYEGIAW